MNIITIESVTSIAKVYQDEITKVEEMMLECIDSNGCKSIQEISTYIMRGGGKRIRPLLLILCSKLFGYEGDKSIALAAAVELIHTATLLHDDVVDESATRRGKASANIIWGNKRSILVGDFLFANAFKLMTSIGSLEILNELSSASKAITRGEITQLEMLGDLSITHACYNNIIEAKTAELFGAACYSGAMLAGARTEAETLKEFGKKLGVIFQITDDMLDYTAQDDEFGKDKGVDFFEGKVTLPIIFLLKEASASDAQAVRDMFGKLDRSDEELCILVDILNQYNIFDKIREMVQDMIDDSLLLINQIESLSVEKSYLIGIITNILFRKL